MKPGLSAWGGSAYFMRPRKALAAAQLRGKTEKIGDLFQSYKRPTDLFVC